MQSRTKELKSFLIRLLISAVAVIVTSYLLPGVMLKGLLPAIGVAAVLALMNAFVKPALILITVPITVFTMGLFLLVINALIILFTDALIRGFEVENFWWALLFSLILSLVSSILGTLTKEGNNFRSGI